MSYEYSGWLKIWLMLLTLHSPVTAMADESHPLEPLDLSSPRATLKSLLTTGDAMLLVLRDEYWDDPSPAVTARLVELAAEAERTLDLSAISPAARFEMGRDGVTYLYEVLSRIELPPEMDIPDAAAYVDVVSDKQDKDKDHQDKNAKDKPVCWSIPHSEITLVRVADGPRTGQFLFSSATVTRAEEFYEKTRTLPYRRDVPLENFAEMRSYLSLGGSTISPRTLEKLPA